MRNPKGEIGENRKEGGTDRSVLVVSFWLMGRRLLLFSASLSLSQQERQAFVDGVVKCVAAVIVIVIIGIGKAWQ